jgi:hypothetical protein
MNKRRILVPLTFSSFVAIKLVLNRVIFREESGIGPHGHLYALPVL